MKSTKLTVDQAIRKAGTLAAQGQKADAETIYREILERFPANRRALDGMQALLAPPQPAGDASVHRARGNTLKQQGRLEDAVASYDIALRLSPDDIEAANNRGIALKDLKRYDEALASYDIVLRHKPDLAVAHYNRGLVFREMGRLEDALECYERALRFKPDFAEACLNRGNVLRLLKRLDEAIASYDRALLLRPDYVDVHNSRGLALQEAARLQEAVASYELALRFRPDFAGAHNNRASALQLLDRPLEAIAAYETALRLKPDFGAALVQLLHQKALICDWSESPPLGGPEQLDIGGIAPPPFQVLAVRDDPELQLALARAWTGMQSPIVAPVPPRPARTRTGKLRIGYFSSDFYNHATMILMARLFELHDKERFEIHAFSYGPDRQDEMQRRLIAAVDAYHDVRHLGDAGVASLGRDNGIDIAVDLKGYTFDTRSGIFAHRTAPVQISYLGYPGSMGARFIDYIIADATIIPPENRRFYSEKVISLPHSYQVNDGDRPVSTEACERAELGLPEHGFVFCCFNNTYKISPREFDIWMRLLQEIEGSVLWLFDTGPLARANLVKEAGARGIDPARLVFAPKLPNPAHLARHRCADLFLDTFNCNAHTTASDALWASLPVLTMVGRSFAARVAASLLDAVGLPELITATPEAYERLAIELATDHERLSAIRSKLWANRLTTPLYDTARFARHIERGYELAYRRWADGLAPDHIRVPAVTAAHPVFS